MLTFHNLTGARTRFQRPEEKDGQLTAARTSLNPTSIVEDFDTVRTDGRLSRAVLGADDFPARNLYRWGLAASGWTGLLVGVLADLGAGFVATGIGYAALATAARLTNRTGGTE